MKHLLLFCFCLFTSFVSFAQDTLVPYPQERGGWYIQAGGGYALGLGRQYFAMTDEKFTIDSARPDVTVFVKEKKGGSLGAGSVAQLNAGYNFRSWAFEIAASYLDGNTIRNKKVYESNYSQLNYTSTDAYAANVLNVIPSASLKSKLHRKMNLYVSCGPVLGLFPMITNTQTSEGSYNTYDKFYFHGNIAWGFASGMSGNWLAGKHFSLRADLRLLYETYTPFYKSRTRSGKDKLYTSYTTNSVSGPAYELQSTYSLSSAVFTLTAKYSF